jgi:hypothetical protein
MLLVISWQGRSGCFLSSPANQTQIDMLQELTALLNAQPLACLML